MASFLDRLFRRRAQSPGVTPSTPSGLVRVSNPVAIPIPEGMPPELLQRVPTRQPRDPSRKRKRRTKVEIAADHKAWVEGTLHQNRVRFNFDRARAEKIGVTHYRWQTVGDYSVCKKCKARNGRRFPLRAVEGFQHPGFMLCVCEPIDGKDEGSSDPCRCFYSMIIK